MAKNDLNIREKEAIVERPSRVGVLLLNSQLRPVHYNAEAANILGYPSNVRATPSLEAVFPTAHFQLSDLAKPASPSVFGFTSGRRRYVCQLFPLDSNRNIESRVQPRVVVTLKREFKKKADLTEWGKQFQLTVRERETVQFLLESLTNKEIAVQMNISPNTVKSFLKLAMDKVGAPNRTGLVARILDGAS